MSDSGRKWIVKNTDGKISGPYVTSRVLEKISSGDFSGDEQIAIHPGGNWLPISQAPEFYDKLLDVLAQEASALKKSTSRSMATSVDRKRGDDEVTEFPGRRKESRGRAVPEKPADLNKPPPAPQMPSLRSESDDSDEDAKSSIIDLRDLNSVKKEIQRELPKLPMILIGAAVLLAIAAFFLVPGGSNHEKFKLLAPRKGQPLISSGEMKERIGRGLTYFVRDTFKTYVKAQNEFVAAVEGQPQNSAAYANLCLAYRELWPYTNRDSTDLRIFNDVAQAAKRLDPGGFNGALCDISYLISANKFDEARGLADTWIVVQSQAAALYDITGDFLSGEEAIGYYDKARVLWPQWLKPYVRQARLLSQMRKFPQAMILLQMVLKSNPDHVAARAELGLAEFNQEHFDRAYDLLSQAVNSSDLMPPATELDSYVAIAQLYEKRGSNSKALQYAKRAYAMNSNIPVVRDIITRLGGSKGLRDAEPAARERMYRGDELMRVGDYVGAQAEYRAAYELDKKNASAALRAAKALWKLNQSADAIDWLNKAIKADPKLIESYTTLADYYSQRFDYLSAANTLRRIQSISPKNFEVFRGFALVELRRNNYKGAADFAKRAMEMYEPDAETAIIMARALAGMSDFPDAQKFTQRALELEPNNVEAQSLYAQNIADLQGMPSAILYVDKLITTYPQIVDYRVTKGEILAREERAADAVTVFKEAISLDRANKRALLDLGKALQATGGKQEALQSYLTAAEMDPSDATPLFLAGQLYAEETRTLPDAVRMYTRVLKINPRYPLAHVQMGWAYLKQGNQPDAIREAMEERAINPGLADAYILAAEGYYSSRQFSNCAKEYQAAVAKGLASTQIYIKMARCYRLSGSLDSALSLLNQAKDRENGNADIYKELGAVYHVKGVANEAIAAYQQYLNLAPAATDREEIQGYINKLESGDTSFGDENK